MSGRRKNEKTKNTVKDDKIVEKADITPQTLSRNGIPQKRPLTKTKTPDHHDHGVLFIFEALTDFRNFHFGKRLAMAHVFFVSGLVLEFYDMDFFGSALLDNLAANQFAEFRLA